MIKEAVYHRPKNEYAYAIDEKSVHIKLKTKKNDVQKVTLIFGDPYDFDSNQNSWISNSTDMWFNGSDDLHDYWIAKVTTKHRRLRYGFLLENPIQSIYYTERGFYKKAPSDASYYFCFPYINKVDIFSPPDWVSSTVWYQIFPERFANGNPSINPKNSLPWNSRRPSQKSYYGGDFQGIMDKLDYIASLGVTGLYLTPIFKAHSNHKYDTIDYMEIDPQFGDKDTFKKLVQKCHAKGIKVMLDAVFNHSGLYFPPFQDVIKNGDNSPYKDWFHLHNLPLKTDFLANYDTFGYVPTMPKLNTENKEVKAYLLNVAKYWIEEFDIDGWRLDVANEVDHAFWRDFRKVVKEAKPDAYILGEVWHDAMPWLLGDQFDAVMNYPLTTAITEYFTTNNINKAEFMNSVNKILNMYPETINSVQFNLLGSHDTARILTLSNSNKEKVKLQMLMQFTMPGTPCIYYGDEISMEGGEDPDCRRCMIWEEKKQDKEMLGFVKKIISLRKQFKVFRTNNNFAFLSPKDRNNIISFTKSIADQELLVVLNNSEFTEKFKLPNKYNQQKVLDLIMEDERTLSDTISLPSYGFAVYLIEKK
ncbi:glycoside hydrolase family 13 protein [Proteinivorax tanatarense]|uniref:Glycoside hydrolase family 13 protein n=1 Tax=Proteinivorax tanatarense TaxID=1260629 RepID=A0AAU7VJN0_9FIRM